MRGPGLRVSNDVRRLWRCPRCRAERQVPATTVAVRCQCVQPPPQMQLIEPIRKVRVEHPPLPPYIEYEELLGEEVPSESTQVIEEQMTATPLAPPTTTESTLTMIEPERTGIEAQPPEQMPPAEGEGDALL